MLGLLAGFSWFNSPRFMGAQGNQVSSWIQHDYIGKRRIWFAISGAVVLVALGSLAVKELNLGIDFEGGTKITFATPQARDVQEVRDQAARIGAADAQIQGNGAEVSGGFREFQLRTLSLSPAELNRLSNGLVQRLGVDREAINVTNVSASFGRQIAVSAIYAILFSLLLVVAYISFRFQWKFAVAVIVAMLHDVIIAIGIYSLIGAEVTTATVCVPDGPRLLDLRHDHHPRPRAQEPAAHAAGVDPDDRERLALGDDPPFAGDDLHAAATPRCTSSAARR